MSDNERWPLEEELKAGNGGAVTQASSATTAVTLNKQSGEITTVALTNAGGVDHQFVLNNSKIGANDIVVVCTKSYGGTADGIPVANVVAVAAGQCTINIRNTGAVDLDALCKLSFAVIKGYVA